MSIQHRQPFTIFQAPNIPLIIWFICLIGSHLFKAGFLHTIFDTVGFIALVIWAIWEIISGVNIFRRLLGLAVLVVTLINHF